MRFATLAVLTALVAPSLTACLSGGSSINAYGGLRELDADELSSVDEPTVYGADLVLKSSLPFLAFEGGYLRSEDDGDGNELGVDEYFLGLRVTPWTLLVSPYAAAGVSYVDGEIEGGSSSESDEVFAYYLRVGAAFSVAMFRIGLDLRGLYGSEVDFGSLDSDLDGYQLTAFVGIGF